MGNQQGKDNWCAWGRDDGTATTARLIQETPKAKEEVAPAVEQHEHIELEIQGKRVPITYEPTIKPESVHSIISKFVPFGDWVKKMSEESLSASLKVQNVHIQHIDLFGSRGIGFVKFKAEVLNNDNKRVPGITFMRGGSVSILVIFKSELDGKEYTLLTVQSRIPIATASSYEIPAGMLDGEGVFSGVAAKELQEETGLVIREDQLVSLSDLAFEEGVPGMFPSPGGCDEFIKLFLYRKIVSQEFIDKLEGQVKGLIENGETIILHVIPLKDLWRKCPDGKSLASFCLYSQLLDQKLISEDY